MSERLLRASHVCDRLNISDTTLWRWRKAGYFPEPKRLPGSSIQGWTEITLNEWILRNFSDHTEEQ